MTRSNGGRNGIGRRRIVAGLIATAAGLGLMGNEAYPRVFEPFGRFAPDMKLANGKVRLGDQPGIGYEAIGEIYDILSTQTLS